MAPGLLPSSVWVGRIPGENEKVGTLDIGFLGWIASHLKHVS